MIGTFWRWLKRLFVAGLALVAMAALILLWRHQDAELITLRSAPATFERRADTFTANVTGELDRLAHGLEYRLNDAPDWVGVGQRRPRVTPPDFTVELPAEVLRPGENRLELRAAGLFRDGEQKTLTFTYDPSPIVLPRAVDWAQATRLDVQDGAWETFLNGDGTTRVRPVPGTEGWDRVLAVTGAFAGGRRVTTDVVFHDVHGVRPFGLPFLPRRGYGFGVFPMWAGQPDQPGVSPRRGWRFSLAWYFSVDRSVGSSFSDKVGDGPAAWVESARSLKLDWDRKYRIVAEAWPETSPDGRHVGYRQRMKWWPDGEPEPAHWLEVLDQAGAPLPEGEYAVALVSLRSAVDFGPVTIEAIDGPGP
ncbi:MAG TPA: hypothetical protein PKA13_12450 [Geminicoccaceae bacterium]|nr:hypothetical protein [Geminicoccus sp.]HMU50577.1 hypothetical protein [Geminicoccaceae bacterium]